MDKTKDYINTKPVLTIKEASEYTGFSVGYLHQLTAAKKIPFSKPNGKSVFFDRKELEDWLMGRTPSVPKNNQSDIVWEKDDIDDLIRWVLAKYAYCYESEKIVNSVHKNLSPNESLCPDKVLDYIYENYELIECLSRKELNNDMENLLQEKKRRQDLGLPLFPKDWDTETENIFIALDLPKEEKAFYDTNCCHLPESAFKWISENAYGGKYSSEKIKKMYAKVNQNHK